MKKVITILALVTSTASAQTMYKMQSVPIYDSLGNQYQLREVFDHLPTSQDTIEFNRRLDKSRNQGPFELITPEFKDYI